MGKYFLKHVFMSEIKLEMLGWQTRWSGHWLPVLCQWSESVR